MSPINSNGSSLKVTTNVAGHLLEDEAYFLNSYKDNKPKQKKEKTLMQPPIPADFLAEREKETQAEDKPTDEKLQAAIETDLKKRNLK